jgi:preprotein translocase subunit SecB
MSENELEPIGKGSIIINTQYVKDLSFENPKAPYGLLVEEQPKVNISLDVAARALQGNMFEVMLSIECKSKVNDELLYLLELHYGGVFTLETEDPKEREMTLLIHCPAILFPYARRVISDVTRDGGFQPLSIDPIDFIGLYSQKKSAEVSAQAENDNTVIN